ncbi:MAG: PDZ domain-containing protein [Thiohalomonadales bacterium]
MKIQHLLYIITIGLGVIIGLLVNPGQSAKLNNIAATTPASTGQSSANNPDASLLQRLQQDINQIKQSLDEEKQARQQLVDQVAQISALGASSSSNNNEASRKDKVTKVTSRPQVVTQSNDGWINTKLLISAGVDEMDVKRISGLFERSEMDKLYLRDRAVREGWTGSNRFREEMSKLNQLTDNLREELSEHDYDAYLYATGKPNRVIVKSALSNSPAAQSGIRPGDTIYKYNKVRVYTWADLRQETAKGDADELVPVELIRDNQNLEVFIKRGPLGIRLDHLSLTPAG